MNRGKTQNGDAPAYTYTIKPLALQEPVRRRFDDVRPRSREPARSHYFKCEAFQDDQITPPPRDQVARSSLRSKLDKHGPPVNLYPNFGRSPPADEPGG